MRIALAIALLLAAVLRAGEPAKDPPAPDTDRVGFPEGYDKNFAVLRTKTDLKKFQLVTVYGNEKAAAVQKAADLPYPNGSVIVMETAAMLKDEKGAPVTDDKGAYKKEKVLGLHVMKREKDFGAAYAQNRSGEWEYVEYRADKSQLTPPQKSFACAQCHMKAGPERDYVYRGRLPEKLEK